LIALICFKTVSIAFSLSQTQKKEAFNITAENDNEETPKKAEKTGLEKETILNSIYGFGHFVSCISTLHNTCYFIHYKYSYLVDITIPPPDDLLTTSI